MTKYSSNRIEPVSDSANHYEIEFWIAKFQIGTDTNQKKTIFSSTA